VVTGCILDPLDFAAIHSNRSACQPTGILRYHVSHKTGNLLRSTVASNAGLFRKLLCGLFYTHSVIRRPVLEE